MERLCHFQDKFNKLFIVYIHLFNLTDLREPQYTIKTLKYRWTKREGTINLVCSGLCALDIYLATMYLSGKSLCYCYIQSFKVQISMTSFNSISQSMTMCVFDGKIWWSTFMDIERIKHVFFVMTIMHFKEIHTNEHL